MEAKNEFRIEGNIVWIKLTQGKETCVDLADWEKVAPYRWSVRKCYKRWYAVTSNTKGSTPPHIYLHRFLNPSCVEVDHKDLNGLNNCSENLRAATRLENSRNRAKPTQNTSGFIGVTWNRLRSKWQASISVRSRYINLGCFDDKVFAAQIRDSVAALLYGEFAVLNFR